MKLSLSISIAVAPALLPLSAWAHEGADHVSPQDLWSAWSFEPWVIAALMLTTVLYVRGLSRSKLRPAKLQIASFTTGMAALVVSLLSPLHRLGSELFSAHMTQHELLMLIVAPVLVMARPGTALLWAFPLSWRARFAAAVHLPLIARSWAGICSPIAAWLIHGLALWLWHFPPLFQATLQSEWVHALQHASFLGTALLFWWALIQGHGGRMSYGAAVAYVFTTAVHTSILGALLTCSSRLWYPVYQGRTAVWGLSALQDQQLGGLIMWVPAGLVYIAIGLWLFAGWLRESERRLAYAQSTDLLREGGHHA